MALLGEYFQYDDSSLYIWRSGNESDPFIDKSDTLKVFNNRSITDEIPDPYTRVKSYLLPENHSFTKEQLSDFSFLENNQEIIKMYEIDVKIYNAPKTPAENQYIVNYSNGIITFHPNLNARDIVCVYKGRGKIIIPATRIWVNLENPYAVDNLQDLIDESIAKMQLLEQKLQEAIVIITDTYNEFIDYTEIRMTEVNNKVNEFIEYVHGIRIELDTLVARTYEAINYAQVAGDYANEWGEYAKNQGDRVDNLITNANLILDNCVTATEETIIATEQTIDARDQAIYAKNTTILVWKSPVENYGEITAQYPNPEIGWTTMILDSGRRYRYSGLQWEEIDNFTVGALPTVSELVNGLMTSEDYIKLKDVSEGLNIDFISRLRTKTLVFVFPDELLHGNQNVILKFPYDGTLLNVQAFLKYEGATETSIQINKISETDFNNFGYFQPILNNSILFPQYERYILSSDFVDTSVNKNDYFSITVLENGVDARDLTVQVNISLD